MKKRLLTTFGIIASITVPHISHAETQLTIYNGGFAVVKDARQLDLKKGDNEIRVTDITAHVEPDSVVLRTTGKGDPVTILEQNYESDPLSQDLMLRKMEGKEVTFEVTTGTTKSLVKGKILRSGYVPHYNAFSTYGQQYAYQQQTTAQAEQPIVEVDGKINFGLPGQPLFDALDPKAFLKPTLLWKLDSPTVGAVPVELSYITGGMRWEASYNLVAPEKGDDFDFIGWVTLENMSGKDFDQSSVKLMAGDVARAPEGAALAGMAKTSRQELDAGAGGQAVTEKAFDEFHLYSLPRPLDLLDREVKQVQFLQSPKVHAKRIYVYDGSGMGQQYPVGNYDYLRTDSSWGTVSQTKVLAMLEFQNSASNGLGVPLPVGKIKLYRSDGDGRPEFIGEDRIDHTPKDETVKLYTGNSFDLVGKRKRTEFNTYPNHSTDETYEITLANHKQEKVQIRAIEHLIRSENWAVTQKTDEFVKTDSHTIEFPIDLAPDETKIVTYRVHYSW